MASLEEALDRWQSACEGFRPLFLGRKNDDFKPYFDTINRAMKPLSRGTVLYHCRIAANAYRPAAWLSTSLTIEGARDGKRADPRYDLFQMTVLSDDVKGIVIEVSDDSEYDVEREVLLCRGLDIRFDPSVTVSTSQFIIELYDPETKVITVPDISVRKRGPPVTVIQLDK